MDKLDRQTDVAERKAADKKGCYFIGTETGNAATDFSHEETLVGMLPRIVDELVHIGLYGFGAAVHRGDGIGLPLHTYAHAPLRAEMSHGECGRTASMMPLQVATENEHLAGTQRGNILRRNAALDRR